MLFAAFYSRLINIRTMVNIVVVMAILGAISLQLQDEVWVALLQRARSAADTVGDTGRVLTAFTNAFSFFDVAGLFGFGSGSTNYGAFALVRGVEAFSWLPAGIYFEEESGRLVLELGILGWLLSETMRIALFYWSVKLCLKGLTHNVRVAGVLAMPEMALGLYLGNGVFSPPIGAVYYWFCVALLSLAQWEQRGALADWKMSRSQRFQAVLAR